MITIFFKNSSDKAVVEMIKTKGVFIIDALLTRLTRLTLMLQSKIVSDKLQGQVLNHRTGQLSASIVAHPAELHGSKIEASVDGAAGVAFYGRYHERGGDGAYTITATNKKALHFMMAGKEVFVKSVEHPVIKQRSFMVSTLREQAQNIEDGLRDAIATAQRKGYK